MIMNLTEYQFKASETAVYPGRKTFQGLIYCVLGLNGEAGEVAEKIKKIIRDNKSFIDPIRKQEIIKELGDVLWYVSQCCEELGVSLEEVGLMNIAKLSSRKERNKINGSGDNR